MQTTVARFLLALEADGASRRTTRWYGQKLGEVCRALAASPPPAIADITPDDLRRVLVELRRRELSAWTLFGYVRAIRFFFRWCQTEGIIEGNPAERLKKPALPKCPPKGVNMEDVRRLIQAADSPRDRAIVLMLLDTGIRAGELLGMRLSDVDLETGVAIVNGKTGTRTVGLNAITCEAIRGWIAVRPDKGTDALWVGKRGRLTVFGLAQILRRLAAKAGVTGRCNAHSFRHGFAREYLLAGGDLASLGGILGHADIRTTADFYAVFTRAELLERQRQLSPVRALDSATAR